MNLTKDKIKEFLSRLGKYKLAILIAAVGIVIFLLPIGKKSDDVQKEEILTEQVKERYEISEEERISSILSSVEGVGSVRVMLTVKDEGVTKFQTDKKCTTSTEQTQSEETTVLIGSGSSVQEPLISQKTVPQYLGALIVCRGGDDPAVRFSLTEALCSLTGLRANQITILKMKN